MYRNNGVEAHDTSRFKMFRSDVDAIQTAVRFFVGLSGSLGELESYA